MALFKKKKLNPEAEAIKAQILEAGKPLPKGTIDVKPKLPSPKGNGDIVPRTVYPASKPKEDNVDKNTHVVYPKVIGDTYKISTYNEKTGLREGRELTQKEWEEYNKGLTHGEGKVKDLIDIKNRQMFDSTGKGSPEDLAKYQEEEIDARRKLANEVGNIDVSNIQGENKLFDTKTGLAVAGAGTAGAGVAVATSTGVGAVLAGAAVIGALAKFGYEARGTVKVKNAQAAGAQENLAAMRRYVNAGGEVNAELINLFNDDVRKLYQARADLKKLGDNDLEKFLSGVADDQAKIDEYLEGGGLAADIQRFQLAIIKPNPNAEYTQQ